MSLKSIIAQAHDFQLLIGEIAHLGCALPTKFVAMGIVAKLPQSWRNFATVLKHKREEISVEELIVALDVGEKARTKDAPSTSSQEENNANMVENKNGNKNKGFKPNKTTSFKKKKSEKKDMKNITCYVCRKEDHMAKDCHFHKNKPNEQGKKKANVTISEGTTSGEYGSRGFLRPNGEQVAYFC